MKTIEELEIALKACNDDDCTLCPYKNCGCSDVLRSDLLAYIQRFKEYAPPVLVGDIIWFVQMNHYGEHYVTGSKIEDITYNQNGWFFAELGHKGPYHKPKDIGKSIFLTSEEAKSLCAKLNSVTLD